MAVRFDRLQGVAKAEEIVSTRQIEGRGEIRVVERHSRHAEASLAFRFDATPFYTRSMSQREEGSRRFVEGERKICLFLKFERKSSEIVPTVGVLHVDLSTFEFVLEIVAEMIEIFLVSNDALQREGAMRRPSPKRRFTFGKYPRSRCACSRNNLIRSSSIISFRRRSTRSASTRSSISRC